MSLLAELRVPLELGGLIRSEVWRGRGVARGEGEQVLAIPGLLVGDETLAPLRLWLKRIGYRPLKSGIRSNVQCSERLVAALEARLERAVTIDGRRAHVLGHSRGGMLAHVLGVRRPDLVASVITLGSPICATLDDFHPVLRRSLRSLTRLGDVRQGLLNSACWTGAPGDPAAMAQIAAPLGDTCCAGFWPDLAAPLPPAVRGTALYSEIDRVVRAGGCVAPGYRPVEVRTSHAGMPTDTGAYHAIGAALNVARGREDDARFPAAQPLDRRPPRPAHQH